MKKIIAVLSVFAVFLALTACGGKDNGEATKAPEKATQAVQTTLSEEELVETVEPKGTVIGSYDPGELAIYVNVINKAGEESIFTVYTDKKNLCDALTGKGMLEAEKTADGMTVKTVNNETHDYETSGYAWVIYVDGEKAENDADKIEIKNGSSYTFKVETF